jgi:hypothetical protein
MLGDDREEACLGIGMVVRNYDLIVNKARSVPGRGDVGYGMGIIDRRAVEWKDR